MPEQHIIDWVHEHEAELAAVLEKRRKQVVAMWPEDADEFDLAKLTLSEMKLCDAVSDIPLPPGFYPKYGEVQTVDGELLEHDFASDGDNIFDIVTAQFFVKARSSLRGSAQAEMVSLAPELFIICRDFVVLCGGIDKVQALLGLEFWWDREFEGV